MLHCCTRPTYRRGRGYGISEKSDKLLRLAEALPRDECGSGLRWRGLQQARADFDAWSLPSSLPDTGVLELKARSSERRHGDAPFLSHDYRETAAWLRQRFLASKAYLPLRTLGGISVALHVRNGDRLPGKRYAKHARLNLGTTTCWGRQGASKYIFGGRRGLRRERRGEEVFPVLAVTFRAMCRAFQWRCPTRRSCSTRRPLEALTHMARADVVVAARSQFSYAAIALSQGVVYPSKWHAHRRERRRLAASASRNATCRRRIPGISMRDASRRRCGRAAS